MEVGWGWLLPIKMTRIVANWFCTFLHSSLSPFLCPSAPNFPSLSLQYDRTAHQYTTTFQTTKQLINAHMSQVRLKLDEDTTVKLMVIGKAIASVLKWARISPVLVRFWPQCTCLYLFAQTLWAIHVPINTCPTGQRKEFLKTSSPSKNLKSLPQRMTKVHRIHFLYVA